MVEMAKSAPKDRKKVESGQVELAMAGAEILLKSLEDEGVEILFGYPGGAVLPSYDSLFKKHKIRHILSVTNRLQFMLQKAMQGPLARWASFCDFWPRGNKCSYWSYRCFDGLSASGMPYWAGPNTSDW